MYLFRSSSHLFSSLRSTISNNCRRSNTNRYFSSIIPPSSSSPSPSSSSSINRRLFIAIALSGATLSTILLNSSLLNADAFWSSSTNSSNDNNNTNNNNNNKNDTINNNSSSSSSPSSSSPLPTSSSSSSTDIIQSLTPPSPSPSSSSSSSLFSSSFFSQLSSNPLFSAGAGVAGLGVGVALLRRAALESLGLFERYFTISLEITSKDKSYQWLLSWVTRNASRSQHLAVETSYHQSSSGDVSAKFNLVPSPGSHWIFYKGKLLHIQRERERSVIDLNSGAPWESVKLSAIGRDRSIFYSVLQEARDLHIKKQEGKTIIYTPHGTEWRPFGEPRKRRPLSSVILDEGISEKLMADIQEFTKSQTWYMDRGVPYRRGYLMYGPPGCGKSSFIQAVAAELAYSICILHLNERGLSDDRLIHLLAKLPPRAILLLEDVDAALKGHRQQSHYQQQAEKAAIAAQQAEKNGDMNRHAQLTAMAAQFVQNSRDALSAGVTFSGILNALDGVASTEERIVFMTTNHLELLDPALIRPGRVDVKIHVGLASPYQMKMMFKRFYPNTALENSEQFVLKLMEKKAQISIAELQAHFLLHKDDPSAAITHINELIEGSAWESRKKRLEMVGGGTL